MYVVIWVDGGMISGKIRDTKTRNCMMSINCCYDMYRLVDIIR